MLAGCTSTIVPLSLPPHAGAVVTVSCPDEPTALLIKRHSHGWQSRNQAEVKVVRYSAKDGPGQGPSADVWVLPAADLANWAAAGKLEPVPEAVISADSSYVWTGLLPLYREKLLVWDKVVYALPLIGEAPVCCYRSDWFDDDIHKAAFEKKEKRPLAVPATWADYERIAAYFATTGSPARPSLPPLPQDDAELEQEFYAVAAAYACRAVGEDEKAAADQSAEIFSFHYDLRTGRPRIDSPGFVYALQRLQHLQPYRGTGSAPLEAFRKGEAALCLAQAWQLAALQEKSSAVRDCFGICLVPGGEGYFGTVGDMVPARLGPNRVPYLGSSAWLAAVPRDAAQREAAFALLADLSGRETSGQIVLDVRRGSRCAGGAIRQDQLEDRTRWDAFDLKEAPTKELKETLRQTLVHRGLKNPALCLRIPGWK